MFYIIAVTMIVLWLLGLVTGTTLGGFTHILLIVALAMAFLGFISPCGRDEYD